MDQSENALYHKAEVEQLDVLQYLSQTGRSLYVQHVNDIASQMDCLECDNWTVIICGF